jgi:hypothetical protein
MLSATFIQHRFLRLFASVLMAISAIAAAPASAQRYDDRDPAYAEFYPALDPHGDWVEHPRYGMTWVPYSNEERDWRPYSRGQWLFTEEHGWYWESDEPFGWVTYHYGRWLVDERYGWMWVPGREWAPAWVAWRQGEDSVGWAPLPPEADLVDDGEVSFAFYDSPRYAPMWMFVAPAALLAPSIWRHAYPRTRNPMFFGRSQFVTHYSYRNRQIYNRGIDRRFIEMRAQRPVPVLEVRPLAAARDMMRRGPIEGQRQVGIYRPQITPPQSPTPSLGRGGERWQRPAPYRGGEAGPGFQSQPPLPQARPQMPERQPRGWQQPDGRRDGQFGRAPPSGGTKGQSPSQPNLMPHPPVESEARRPFGQPPMGAGVPPQFRERPSVGGEARPPAPPPAARPAPSPANARPAPQEKQPQQPQPQPNPMAGRNPFDMLRNR